MNDAQAILGVAAGNDQPLIGIFTRENGREVIRYFTDEAQAEASLPANSVQDALSLAGVWSDLDWDEMEADLYRIGHSTPPTPALDDRDV